MIIFFLIIKIPSKNNFPISADLHAFIKTNLIFDYLKSYLSSKTFFLFLFFIKYLIKIFIFEEFLNIS